MAAACTSLPASNLDAESLQGPSYKVASSIYAPVLNCLAKHPSAPPMVRARDSAGNDIKGLDGKYVMVPAPISFSVISVTDDTGKISLATENSSGNFLSQGAGQMLKTSLQEAGVPVIERSTAFWAEMLREKQVLPSGNISMAMPDVGITASFDSFDVMPGRGAQVTGAITAGHIENRVRLGLDGSAFAMPLTSLASAGTQLAAFRYGKQVVQYGNNIGINGFVGNPSSQVYLEFDAGADMRENLQEAQAVGSDVIAYRAIRDVTHNTTCDDMFSEIQTIGHPDKTAYLLK